MPHDVKRHTSSSNLDEVNFQAVLAYYVAYLAQIRIGRRAAHGWLVSRARIKIILELWNVMRERLWKIWSQRSIGPTCQHNGKLYSGQKFEQSGPWADLSWSKYEARNQFSDINFLKVFHRCTFGNLSEIQRVKTLLPFLLLCHNFSCSLAEQRVTILQNPILIIHAQNTISSARIIKFRILHHNHVSIFWIDPER